MRSPVARGFLVTLGAGLSSRFDGTLLIEIERRCICGEGESDSGEEAF